MPSDPGTDPIASTEAPAHVVSAAPHRARPPVWGLAAALTVVVGLLAYMVIVGRSSNDAEGATSAAAPEAADAPSTVRITLRASPATARFSIDNGPWMPNPYVAEVQRDAGSHTIRIEAEGYEPATQQVSFTHDVLIDKGLTPLPPPEEPSAKPRTQGPVPVPREDGPIVKPPRKKPPRKLDGGDPWEEDGG
jgi:hypothetical protein